MARTRKDDKLQFDFQPDGVADKMSTDGAVLYRIVRGYRDDDTYGIVGAIWHTVDGSKSGYVANWTKAGNAMTTWVWYWRNALADGFTPQATYDYAITKTEGAQNTAIEQELPAASLAYVRAQVDGV